LPKTINTLKRAKKMNGEIEIFMEDMAEFIYDPAAPDGLEDLFLEFDNSRSRFFKALEKKFGKS
jgi:hypothetical protein